MRIQNDVIKINQKPYVTTWCIITTTSVGHLIAILGILFGMICAVLRVQDEKLFKISTTIFTVLSAFVVVTVLFIAVTILLLSAVINENTTLMSNYIWLAIEHLSVQVILASIITIVFIMEGQYPVAVALIWTCIMMIVGLGWTFLISMINLYRRHLFS